MLTLPCVESSLPSPYGPVALWPLPPSPRHWSRMPPPNPATNVSNVNICTLYNEHECMYIVHHMGRESDFFRPQICFHYSRIFLCVSTQPRQSHRMSMKQNVSVTTQPNSQFTIQLQLLTRKNPHFHDYIPSPCSPPPQEAGWQPGQDFLAHPGDLRSTTRTCFTN